MKIFPVNHKQIENSVISFFTMILAQRVNNIKKENPDVATLLITYVTTNDHSSSTCRR